MDELEFVRHPSPPYKYCRSGLTIRSPRPSPTCKTWCPSTCSTRRPVPTRSTTRRARPLLTRKRRHNRPRPSQTQCCCQTPKPLSYRTVTTRTISPSFLFSRRRRNDLSIRFPVIQPPPPLFSPLFLNRLTRNCIPMSRDETVCCVLDTLLIILVSIRMYRVDRLFSMCLDYARRVQIR